MFVPRYRGSWESGGSFLKISPHRDVLDVIDQLPRGFKDLWSGKTYKIARPEIYLIGSSFGGAAVILASRDPRVRRAVAFSPVTDWRVETKAEPIDKLRAFTRAAFGNAYRGTQRDWNKLKSGTFYNPAHEAASIDGAKLLIFHAKDDKIVYARTSAAFARATGARLVLLPQRRPSFHLQHDGAEILEENKTVFKIMVLFINGSINSGKSTVSKLLAAKIPNSAIIEIDALRGMIEWMPIDQAIPINLENAISIIKNLTHHGISCIIPYPLSQKNYEYVTANLSELGADIRFITLAPLTHGGS